MFAKRIDRTKRRIAATLLLCIAAAGINSAASDSARATGTIAFVGVIRDQTDFKKLNIGRAGYWFPQFGAKSAVAGRPTSENPREALPPWVAPLNHVTSFLDPAYKTRTFSQDGPARSAGGVSKWNEFKLPNGETGRSGAIVDPHARKNSNNTINRIQLRDAVPASFLRTLLPTIRTASTTRRYGCAYVGTRAVSILKPKRRLNRAISSSMALPTYTHSAATDFRRATF